MRISQQQHKKSDKSLNRFVAFFIQYIGYFLRYLRIKSNYFWSNKLHMSYLIFLLLFISALLWLTTNDSFTDKGAAVVFSWIIAPAFVILLIALGKMTPTDLAIVAGGGGAVIPLIIAGIRKLIAFSQQPADKHTNVQMTTDKATPQDAETIAVCEAMRAEMDKQIATALQDIKQLKTIHLQLPYYQLPKYKADLNQASKQLVQLKVDFDHHSTHIHQQLNKITNHTAKCDQLSEETQTQRTVLSNTQHMLDAFIHNFEKERHEHILTQVEAGYHQANKQKNTLRQKLRYLQDEKHNIWQGDIQQVEYQTNNYQETLEQVSNHVQLLVEEVAQINNHTNALLVDIVRNQKLAATLKAMQEELATLQTHFDQQKRAYQPVKSQKYPMASEGFEQKQALYTQAKRAYQEAQQALTDHMAYLWAIYNQHHPQQSTQDIKVLNAFMRQHFPQEMELFRKKREQRSLTQAKYEAIKKELKAFTKEMDKLQLAAALANNTEESINQLWQTYTLGDDSEEFWQTYEQRLQTLDGWQQVVYLFK